MQQIGYIRISGAMIPVEIIGPADYKGFVKIKTLKTSYRKNKIISQGTIMEVSSSTIKRKG